MIFNNIFTFKICKKDIYKLEQDMHKRFVLFTNKSDLLIFLFNNIFMLQRVTLLQAQNLDNLKATLNLDNTTKSVRKLCNFIFL